VFIFDPIHQFDEHPGYIWFQNGGTSRRVLIESLALSIDVLKTLWLIVFLF